MLPHYHHHTFKINIPLENLNFGNTIKFTNKISKANNCKRHNSGYFHNTWKYSNHYLQQACTKYAMVQLPGAECWVLLHPLEVERGPTQSPMDWKGHIKNCIDRRMFK